MNNGYLWRLPHADASTLKRLITDIFPVKCWNFGGALLWDVRTNIPDKRENLRPITEVPSSAVEISGDFGHAFAEKAEVRWKRRDDGNYDLLVLSESPADPAPQFGLTPIAIFPEVVTMADLTALLLDTPPELKAQKLRCRLDYNEYRTANGAAQFARYVRYHTEKEG
ncbi:MAG: hypothetical protein WCF99_02920 [Chloroflexales bacterium]